MGYFKQRIVELHFEWTTLALFQNTLSSLQGKSWFHSDRIHWPIYSDLLGSLLYQSQINNSFTWKEKVLEIWNTLDKTFYIDN